MPRRIKHSNEPKSSRPSDHPETGTRTGTACPACGKEQMWCPSGVVCSDFETCDGDKSDNHGYPSDIPFAPSKKPKNACRICGSLQTKFEGGVVCAKGHASESFSGIPFVATETDRGESLDEALSEHVKEQPTSHKRQAKGTVDIPHDSPSLGEMTRIVERVFKFDFDEAYDTVTRFLASGDDRRLDLGFLQKELDRSAEMAALAHRLFTNAREACEIFEIDKGLILASMREEARHKLDEDKRNRIRLKSVTDADVSSMMQMQDPAKWRDLRIKTVRMEATKDHLERLADLARKRIDVLKTLVEKK